MSLRFWERFLKRYAALLILIVGVITSVAGYITLNNLGTILPSPNDNAAAQSLFHSYLLFYMLTAVAIMAILFFFTIPALWPEIYGPAEKR